jgi:hypothetical protein
MLVSVIKNTRDKKMGSLIFICQYCGDKFIPKDSSASHLERNTPKYCSTDCRDNAQKKHVVVNCNNPNCQKVIDKAPWELKKHPCCDVYCAKEWQKLSGIFAGANNPAWRGGLSYRYRGENWDEQREKAMERDEYACQQCGLNKKEIELEVHHIKPYHLFRHYTEANSLDNLKTLCRVCHMIEEHEYIKAHPDEPTLRRIPKTTPTAKPCIDCRLIFLPLRHSDKACNECMTINCLNCGKDHLVEQYYMLKYRKFCSPECVTTYIGVNNRKIDHFTLEYMKALRDQGLSYSEIADKVGFSKYAVRTNLVKLYGLRVVEHTFTHVDQIMYEKMKTLRDQGFSTRKIASKIGIGKSTVATYLKKLDESVLLPSLATHRKQI